MLVAGVNPSVPVINQGEAATNTPSIVENAPSQDTTKDTKQDTRPKNPNQGIEKVVKSYFKNLPIMAEISKCESTFKQFNEDGTIHRGRVNKGDVGVMQINEYYHKDEAKKLGLDLYSLEGNLAYAKHLYDTEGTVPWNSSSPCWLKSQVAMNN